ncbi:hypothetical protein OGH69_05945 [Flavobacterium sp. MFBS3-15]|uniref:hypothetical protein n=1 Tax=Flavobacterium sp. MFBS3-15 TaxID=2989816 RepID=UPI002235DFFE|nr:hypothetical protein [Flavobacterium sp. MFBS3-15]MCW4468496.1 hypothetical protein [Flavobacterium sp. MFBS3-15]
MKNLKTALRALPLAIIIMFTACSGDDSKETGNNNNSTDKFVGKWKLTGFEDLASGNYTAIQDNRTVYEIDGDGGGKYHLSTSSSFDLTWENLGDNVYHVEHYGGDWTYEIEFRDNNNTIRIEDQDSASYYGRK